MRHLWFYAIWLARGAFFEGLGKLVDKYDSKTTQKAIDNLLQFTKTGLLFQSNFNKLYATSKTFTLEFERNPKRYYTTQESQTIDLESFITIKGIKALGNQFTADKIKQINRLEPLPYEEPIIEEEATPEFSPESLEDLPEGLLDDDGQITLNLE